MFFALFISGLVLALHVQAVQKYSLEDAYRGFDFYEHFNWETMNDPTHGRVNYVSLGTAITSNLTFTSPDSSTFFMKADHDNIVHPDARGRDSIRISSKKAYDESVIVLELDHMPWGCATWPAFWTLSAKGPWPEGGEIDIIEGVNKNTLNLASLHTTRECRMVDNTRAQAGNAVSWDCDANVNFNQGCGTSFDDEKSYGPQFNANGGGWYVMHRSPETGVRVWFWSRHDGTIPKEIRFDKGVLYPDDSWGMPKAHFPPTNCDHAGHFNAHRIVFDLTFCGDWAGSVFPTPECAPVGTTCQDFVDHNPDQFREAYWAINSLRVYSPW